MPSRSRPARRSCGLALALVALAAGPARAAPPPIAWDAPAGCPGQAAVAAQAAALLAGSTQAPDPALRLRFVVRPTGDGRLALTGAIEGAGEPAQRTLVARDCEALAGAAALIAAIAVDPELAAPGPAPEPAPEAPAASVPLPPAPEPAPNATPASPVPPDRSEGTGPEGPATLSEGTGLEGPAPRSEPRRAARPRGFLELSAGLGLGALPRPAGVLQLAGGVRGRRWSVALRTAAWLPREAPVAGAPEVGGRFWLWTAGAQACAIVGRGRIEVPLCGGVDAGVLTGRGTGALANHLTARSPWLGAHLGPQLRVRLTRRWALGLAAEAFAVLARPHFVVEGRGEACCSARVGAQFRAGVLVELP